MKSAQMNDENNPKLTDKGKSFAKIFHWTAFDKRTQDSTEFSQNFKLSDQERYVTANAMQDAVTATLKKMRYIVDDLTNGLDKSLRQRLRGRLDFIDARNQFTDLLSFDEFETIPTTANTWFGLKPIVRAAKREIGKLSVDKQAEQDLGDQWKSEARKKGAKEEDLQPLDEDISTYIVDHDGKVDDRVLKALFAVRSARFVLALKAKTDGLIKLQDPNAVKVWGDKQVAAAMKGWPSQLDPAVAGGIQKIADDWVKQLGAVGDNEGKNAVIAARDAYLQELQKVAG
jgi:hypothetical protein